MSVHLQKLASAFTAQSMRLVLKSHVLAGLVYLQYSINLRNPLAPNINIKNQFYFWFKSDKNFHHYHNQIFDKCASASVGPLLDNWLAACIADLEPDLQVLLS